jgi:hypothetical protein
LAGDSLIAEIRVLPPLHGLMEGRDASLPDDLYPPVYAPAVKNVRVAPGKVSTRRGISLWKSLPGVGRVRLLDNVYTAAGQRIRLAARGNSGGATLYDYVEGTDTSFNATSGGTSLGGSAEQRFKGVMLNDTYYFTDRSGALRKYQESPSSGNQVRSVALPTKPSAAPGVKPKTYETLEDWTGNSGAAPYGWTVSDTAKFDIESGTGSGGYESPTGGQTVLLNTKTNPKNSPITENVTAEAIPSSTIAFWINATNIPTQIVFQYGLIASTDYTESLSPPVKTDWYPVFVQVGNIGTINYKRFLVVNNAGAADTYVSKLTLPGRLQGAYRWRYSHYDPTLQRESALSDASLSNTPLDLSAIGVTGKPATAAAFQKSAALTFTSDSGSDSTTTQIRVYRSGGTPALTKDGRGIDVWCRVGTVYDYSSTLSAGPSAGATSISVTSATNLAIGDWLVIEKGTVSKEEYVRITNIVGTTLTISTGLQYAHSNGVAIQMAFVDNIPNEQVDLSTRIYGERDDPPTAAKWIARSPDGRIWLANYTSKPTGVRVSNRATPDRPNDYEVFPSGVDPITRRDPLQGWDFEIGGDTTDEEIMWLGFFRDRPFAFTKSRLYAINAMSQLDWGPYAVVPSLQLGCINGDTVCELDGWLYWVTDGPRVMRFDGRGEVQEVSELKVNERLEGAPTTDWDQWFAVPHVRRDGHIYNLGYTPGDESEILQLNTSQSEQGAWEVFVANDVRGVGLEWQAGVVRNGGSDARELFLADSNGDIYQFEVDVDDDEGAAVEILFTSKKFDMGGVGMVQSVYTRLDPVDDEVALTVSVGGSEYGEGSRDYTLDLSAASGEIRTRTHRNLIGRWVQVSYAGQVSHRPAIREVIIRYLPWRSGRVSL